MDERYDIIGEAGQGGFGRVDKALDRTLERQVAIKTLDPLFKNSPTPKDIDRFKREARVLASLSHPNIPAIYDVRFSEEQKTFSIIFEWIDGMNLNRYLQDHGVLSLDDVKRWFANLCSALSHAHSKGVTHRDVKPSNIIITHNFESCYIVDFGIALQTDDIRRITGNSTPLGSAGYMSPEQEKGEQVDGADDVYALGIVLYECLSGSKPAVGAYRPLREANEAIPPAVDDLVKSCIAPKAIRLKTPAEFFKNLTEALRPHGSFSDVLSKGSLFVIEAALAEMDSGRFVMLPPGQRVLLITRMKDLVRVDSATVRPAVAALLGQLVRVAPQTKVQDYHFITEKALLYGFRKSMGPNWTGNPELRQSLVDIAVSLPEAAHATVIKALREFLDSGTPEEITHAWFSHDLRALLQRLLANPACAEVDAEFLGERLEWLNTETHQAGNGN
jgi:serine/threonine protein kinase